MRLRILETQRTPSDRRNWFATKGIQSATHALMSTGIWNVSVNGKFPGAPTVYLPVHQSMLDIPFFGYPLLREFGDSPHMIMRSSLSAQWLLRSFGGHPIGKTDVLRGLQGEARRRKLEEIKNESERTYRECANLFHEGCNISLFPEGSRWSTAVQTGALDDLAGAIHARDRAYPRLCVLGASVYRKEGRRLYLEVNIGNPFDYDTNRTALKAKIADDLSRLSPGVIERKTILIEEKKREIGIKSS